MEPLAVAARQAANQLNAWRILKTFILASLVLTFDQAHQVRASNLSPNASIILPGDPSFDNATERWQNDYAETLPQIGVVVNVKTEEDVQEAIRFANKHNRPFIAYSGGHGATTALAEVKDGIQIDMRGMNQVSISDDGRIATIGGGTTIKQLDDYLWANGKETGMLIHGICECVGVVAPMLGGGHGWLQGKYGLAADQLIEARLVLSNGTAVVVSDDSHRDLFWAIRGAGHNFGFVTEMKYKIYDVGPETTWSYQSYTFGHDKLEQVFEVSNRLRETQPADMIHWAFAMKSDFDPVHPIIEYAFVYHGTSSELSQLAEPMFDVGPIHVESGERPLPDMTTVFRMDLDGAGCAHGRVGLRYPIVMDTWNPEAVRKAFDELDLAMQEHEELNNTRLLFEGYSTQAVKAVPEESTAFPHRQANLLFSTNISFLPNAALEPIAERLGAAIRQHLLDGTEDPSKLRAYVNYARGDESVQSMYGWEEWRLERLRKLKGEWDPLNRLRYYAPIV